jgi:hypothetical protein
VIRKFQQESERKDRGRRRRRRRRRRWWWCKDSLVHTKSLSLAVRCVIMRTKSVKKFVRGNAINIPTGLVWVVSDRFMQAGTDPHT